MALKDANEEQKQMIVSGLDMLVASLERRAIASSGAIKKAFEDEAEKVKICRSLVVMK